MSHLNAKSVATTVATTAMTLCPPENLNLAVFNLEIFDKTRQIAKLKHPPVIRYM